MGAITTACLSVLWWDFWWNGEWSKTAAGGKPLVVFSTCSYLFYSRHRFFSHHLSTIHHHTVGTQTEILSVSFYTCLWKKAILSHTRPLQLFLYMTFLFCSSFIKPHSQCGLCRKQAMVYFTVKCLNQFFTLLQFTVHSLWCCICRLQRESALHISHYMYR